MHNEIAGIRKVFCWLSETGILFISINDFRDTIRYCIAIIDSTDEVKDELRKMCMNLGEMANELKADIPAELIEKMPEIKSTDVLVPVLAIIDDYMEEVERLEENCPRQLAHLYCVRMLKGISTNEFNIISNN